MEKINEEIVEKPTKQFEYEKSIVESLPNFTKKELQQVREDLINFLENQNKTKNFMLLSNEIRYYTIFQKTSAVITATGMGDKILSFLNNDSFLKELGRLKVLKRTGENEIEIWLGATPFLLFDADSFFVSI